MTVRGTENQISKEREIEEIAFIKSVRISVTAVSWKVNFSDTRMGDGEFEIDIMA